MFSRLDYLSFWQKAKLNATRLSDANHAADKILKFRHEFYEPVEAATGIPWFVLGAIDMREENFNHTGYFGNGDPLNKKTVHVPRGRGPFKTWYEGAIDAIHLDGLDRLPSGGHWDIVTSLIKCEAFNGSGYAHMGMRSPYVWGGTNMQQRGKYVKDSHFDPSAWDVQIGCAAVLLALKAKGIDVNEG